MHRYHLELTGLVEGLLSTTNALQLSPFGSPDCFAHHSRPLSVALLRVGPTCGKLISAGGDGLGRRAVHTVL